MFEATKAMTRRLHDSRFATKYFVGDGIDIGCGGDCIIKYKEWFPLMNSVRAWDQEDGDAQTLEGIESQSFDFVHSSHSLEHMADPYIAFERWVDILKPTGHIILTLPDEDMFEQGRWPSTFAGSDHVSSWTIFKFESWSPKSINCVEFFSRYRELEILKIEKIDQTFLYDLPFADQTRTLSTECAIEIILRKRTEQELKDKGKLPPPSNEFFTINT